MTRDGDMGAQLIAGVTPDAAAHALNMLRPYHGQSNSWGARSALTATIGMLGQRYEHAKCDSVTSSCCVRCNVMFLVNAMARLLATQSPSGDSQ